MTINDFKNKVNSFNVNSFAKLSIFDNRNQVVEAVRTSWNSSETPSGTSWAGDVTWDGGEVGQSYARIFKIHKRTYKYRFINISGDTRRNLDINQNAEIFSKTAYWSKIVRNFKSKSIDITDFAGRSVTISPKKEIQIILINHFKRHLNG